MHYYSLVTFPQPESISSILKSSYRKLAKIDGRNDSQMIFYDQVIPAGTHGLRECRPLGLALPIARSHPNVGTLFVTQNAYPREALVEAMLRFIEEDLADRPE